MTTIVSVIDDGNILFYVNTLQITVRQLFPSSMTEINLVLQKDPANYRLLYFSVIDDGNILFYVFTIKLLIVRRLFFV